MASSPVLSPDIPYVGAVEGGLAPGKMVKIQGKVPSNAVRFAINYQLGPNLNPRDDIAIHLSPRFSDGFITRNHIQSMSWGPEENGPLVLRPNEEFEVILLCEPLQYKIAINGRHYTEFGHRLPYQKVSHLVIDGDVEVTAISWQNIAGAPVAPRVSAPPDVPTADFGPPAPGGLYPQLNPHAPPPPPPAYGGYGPPTGGKPYGYQPGYEKPEEEDAFGGCLDKVGLALGGLVAAGGVAAAMHAMNKRKEADGEKDHEKSEGKKTESEGSGFNLGALGTALAGSLVSNALAGDQGQQPGYPSQPNNHGMLGSILGVLGGGHPSPGSYPPPQQPADHLGGLGSILGVLGGGGQQQPAYQPSGGYSQPYAQQGGYNQGSAGSDLLSGLGGALLSSAIDSFSKRKSHGDDYPSTPQQPPPQQPYYNQNYGPPVHDPPPPPKPSTPPPASGGGGKLSAAEISKGLGLGDEED